MRRAILHIDECDLIAALEGRVRLEFDLPPDARFVMSHADPMRRGFAVLVESEFFVETPRGGEYPRITSYVVRQVAR